METVYAGYKESPIDEFSKVSRKLFILDMSCPSEDITIGGKEIIFNSSNSIRRMSYFSIAMTKAKKNLIWELMVQERVGDYQGGGHGNRQAVMVL